MARRFWFMAGMAAGTAMSVVLLSRREGRGGRRVVRLEKSLQIGKPVSEVFQAWSDLAGLPQRIGALESVERYGQRSRWAINVGGRRVQWDAELTQNIPNQALAWKSLNGPKHTGRIDFSDIAGDTLLHVTMNWAPPVGVARFVAADEVERYLDQALRDFKASLEGKGQEARIAAQGFPPQSSVVEPGQQRATGTGDTSLHRKTQTSRFGNPETTVGPERKD
jgi:uncharacterized membrane protein